MVKEKQQSKHTRRNSEDDRKSQPKLLTTDKYFKEYKELKQQRMNSLKEACPAFSKDHEFMNLITSKNI
jgi:hypothetical protein